MRKPPKRKGLPHVTDAARSLPKATFCVHANLTPFCLCLDKDTGFIFTKEVSAPIEPNPFGQFILPFRGTKEDAQRQLRRYQRNPRLIAKYLEQ